jgi:predicted RNA binding protein YcfA (HicA-like mRNA interferase family)
MASMTYRELARLLVLHGCQYVRDARHAHEIWHCPGGRQFSVPKNLKGEGTLRKILKDAGIPYSGRT